MVFRNASRAGRDPQAWAQAVEGGVRQFVAEQAQHEWARILWQKGGTVARRIMTEEYHLTVFADLRLLNSLCAI